MTTTPPTRIGWADLPDHVRHAVENILGDRVVTVAGQRGGFSPGTADRVVTAGGGRAFVKAVSTAQNEATPGLHRREALVTAALPPGLPVARLLGLFDDGEWVALVLSDIDGSLPDTPWNSADLALVLDSLHAIARLPLPDSLLVLPRAADELRYDFAGWERIRLDPPARLDPWVSDNLPQLERLAAESIPALAGAALVHLDVRADNVLITGDDTAVLVDWPWASVGPGWLDALTLLVNVRAFDTSVDVDTLLQTHPVFDALHPDDVDRVLAGLAAYLIDASRMPAPKGLPTIRAFQAQQGEGVLGWLRVRLARSAAASVND